MTSSTVRSLFIWIVSSLSQVDMSSGKDSKSSRRRPSHTDHTPEALLSDIPASKCNDNSVKGKFVDCKAHVKS